MHFNDFLQLDETDQLEILWYNGEQIGKRKENDYLVLLYQVEGFYVEVYYHTRLRAVRRYVSFQSTSRLGPYLQQIDLSVVFRQVKKQPKGRDNKFVQQVLTQVFASPAETRKPDWVDRVILFFRKMCTK
jgi:hypothetical protein